MLCGMSLLQRSLNFAIAPRIIPHEDKDIICQIEDAIVSLPEAAIEEIRQDCTLSLRHAKPPKNNLNKEESIALKKLKLNKEIMILKADKGNVTVIKNMDYYHKKMIEHLTTSRNYNKVDRMPTIKLFGRSQGLSRTLL